jgi:hypothetical protein
MSGIQEFTPMSSDFPDCLMQSSFRGSQLWFSSKSQKQNRPQAVKGVITADWKEVGILNSLGCRLLSEENIPFADEGLNSVGQHEKIFGQGTAFRFLHASTTFCRESKLWAVGLVWEPLALANLTRRCWQI